MWRMGIILAVVLISVVVGLVALLALFWCIKSRKRKEEVIERKNIIRASIKLQRYSLNSVQSDHKLWKHYPTRIGGK